MFIDQNQHQTVEQRQRLIQRIRILLLIKDIESAELVLMLSTFWWAISLSRSENEIAGLKIYQTLTEFFPQWAWAASWWIVGVGLLVGVVFGSYKMRRIVLQIAAATWIFTGVLLMTGGEFNVWSGQCIIFGATAIWGYIRLRLNKEPIESFVEV